jgi:hypothetical protein
VCVPLPPGLAPGSCANTRACLCRHRTRLTLSPVRMMASAANTCTWLCHYRHRMRLPQSPLPNTRLFVWATYSVLHFFSRGALA